MYRRNFFRIASAGAAAEVLRGQPAKTRNAKPVLMKAGTQQGHSADLLRALAAFGVNHICSGLPALRMDENWTVDGLTRLRQHVESFRHPARYGASAHGFG